MAKPIRNSKPLLFILASAIGIATLIAPIPLIKYNRNDQDIDYQFNTLANTPVEQVGGYNKVDKSMFKIIPSGINRYNFSTVRKGQTSTPYGWVGVADDSAGGVDHEVVLVNWSGEVIWRTDLRNYQSNPLATYTKIHDIKYDAGTNSIFILTSNKESGAFDSNFNNKEHDTVFYILNAVTGQIISSHNFNKTFIETARSVIKDNRWGEIAFNSGDLNSGNHWRLNDLYSLDVVSSLNLSRGFGSNDKTLVSYAPNSMQLYRNNKVLTMFDLIVNFHTTNFAGLAIKNKNGFGFSWKTPNLRDILKKGEPNGNWKWTLNGNDDFKWESGKGDYVKATNTHILTSPFWSADPQGNNKFFLHFFFASGDQNRTYHSFIQFDSNLNPVASNMEQMQGRDAITGASPLNLEIGDRNWVDNQNSLNKDLLVRYPANTKINHNILKPNIVTFAFPYSAKDVSGLGRVPLYNVAQIVFSDAGLIVGSNGSKIESKIFTIGKDTNLYPTSLADAPYKFGRLASVNPFDNSFVYFGNPKLSNVIGGWIVRSISSDVSKPMLNGFSINNIDGNKSSREKLWTEGFGFDPVIKSDKLNLYYNHSNRQENFGAPDGFVSNQMGMLGQFSQRQDSFTTSNVQNANLDSNAYASVLFTRPDITAWYSKTSFNFKYPANLLAADQLIVGANKTDLNGLNKDWTPRKTDDKHILSVVSHEMKSTTKDNLRALRTPGIIVGGDKGTGSRLKLTFSWDYADGNFDNYYKNVFNNWSDANNKMRYRITKEITNPSWQIFNKFGAIGDNKWEQKADKWTGNLNNLNLQVSSWVSNQNQWHDVRNGGDKDPDKLFGKIRNAIDVNGQTPLRVLVQLVAPSGNLPGWFNDFKRQYPQFWQPAPLVAFGNETNFNNLMQQFNTALMQNINNKSTDAQTVAPLGLANLKIKVFYGLNPAAATQNKIYQVGDKQVILNNSGQATIYQDYSTADDGIIYDQSATTFQTLKNQGLVSSNVSKNWLSVPPQTKLMIQADANQMRWPIVDTGQSFTEAKKEKIFQAEYGTNRQNIVIKAKSNQLDQWFKNTITTMNFKYGLQVIFEGQVLGQTNWQAINTQQYSDESFGQIYNQQLKGFVLPTSLENVKKMRIKLIPFANINDPNVFIQWTNISEAKMTSAQVLLGASAIKFDRNWISQNELSSNNTLDQISNQDFIDWLNKIKPSFEKANPSVSGVWSMVEVVYWFEGQEYNQTNLISKLKSILNSSARSDKGWFYLWVGTPADKNGLKIEAEFRIKPQYQTDFSLVDVNGNQISSAQTKVPIITKVKTKFDLQQYFDQLQQTPLVTTANNNQIINITMPFSTGGNFDGLSFDDIQSHLSRVGLKFQFQASTTTGWTNLWVDNLKQITTYNLANPQLKIRAIVRDPAFVNSLAYDGSKLMNEQSDGRTINLQLPKLIQTSVDFQTQIQQLVTQINPFSGNTKFLVVNQINEFETKLYDIIKNSSQFNDQNFRTFLKIKYSVGLQNHWLGANQLTNQLATATSDLDDNNIRIKFVLEGLNASHPEYVLDQNLQSDFEILPSQNTQVKIYVHGSNWEAAIQQIVASGTDWAKITYSIPSELDNLKLGSTKGVELQWKFEKGDNSWKSYPNTPLPTNIANDYPTFINASAIEVRINHLSSDAVYHYGPQQDNPSWQVIGKIDLSKLAQNVIVDSSWFNQIALVDTTTDIKDLDAKYFSQWEAKIKDKLQANSNIKNQVEIQYNIVWPNQTNVALNAWGDPNAIINALKYATKDYSNPLHNAIVSLYDNDHPNVNQTKIIAKFVAKPNSKIIFVDDANNFLADDQLQGQIKTNHVQTTIDLSNYWTKLISTPATVITNNPAQGTIQNQSITPTSSDIGNFLGGKSFADLSSILKGYGLTFLFNPNLAANPNWVENGAIDHYDPQQAKMGLALNNQSINLNVKLSSTEIIVTNADNKAAGHTIKLQVPKLIELEQSWFDGFIGNHGFSGNTKHLVIDKAKIAALINNLQTNLSKVNPELAQAPIVIKFQLGATNFVDASELVTALANQSNDLTTRVIKYKIELDAKANPNDWILGGYATTNGVALFSEDQSPLKIFLHDDGIVDRIKNVQLSGTNDNVQWNFNQLVVNQVSGIIASPEKQSALKVEYNLNSANSNHNDWTSQQVHQFVAGKQQMWIRLNYASTSSEAKYEFENSTAIRQALPIDLTKLKSTIKLQANWLNKIVASNNLINLELDESALRNHLLDQNVLDPVKISDLEVQYSINGKTNWLNKENFISFLKQNDGKEDGDRFILKRENVKVRFGLKSDITADAYGWEIDGVQIHSNTQYQNHYQNLVGASYNQNLKGVINLTLVPEFIKDNFWIKGTNQRPQLEVKHATSILNKFNLYQSDRLFEIVLSTSKSNGDFEWNQAIPIWQNGTFVSDLNVVLQDVKNAAIRFKVTAPNYVVKTAPNQDNFAQEMTFDISDQIEVITLIANIFQAARKTLAIQTRENGVAKWMQGHGQFQIMVGDSNWMPENQSAQDFLQANAALSQALKDKLEFVYQIFDNQPTEEQISVQSSPECINDPTSAWTVFPNQNGWSGDLGLKVGNYIMVALRIKPEFASGPQAYVLENQEATVLIPVNKQVGSDEPIEKRHPGRVAGYLVDPLQALVVKNSVVLASQKPQTRGLLDGWAKLERLSLANEPDENARGIDLELNFYNKFHVDQSNKVLISASGAKLVQREQNNMDRGLAYVDVNGKPIQDREGQVVYLWTNPLTGRLANPLTASTPTLSLKLTSREFANYTLDQLPSEPNLVSLFRNQKLTLTYKAKEGLGTSKLPDYALKQSYEFDLEPLVSPQIKFAIENPQNIIYDWLNRDAFAADKIEYAAPVSALKPVNGFARVKTIAQLQRRRRNNGTEVNIISGPTGPEAALNFLKTIQADFKNQLKFTTTLIKKAGGSVVRDNSANLYEFNNLHNGDQIVVNLDAAAPDQIYTDAPEPLVILVSGLAVEAPDPALLQWLRVEQSGFANGRGAFRLLVHNPNGPYQAPEELLRGWQFLIRVWDGATHQIKIDWTADQEMLTNLSNGDRVEWKLVDREKNPVQDAYYNTVALRHEITGANGAIKFNFGQVNYADGPNSQQVVYAGIGDYPPKAQAEHFPAASGFTIAGLQDQSQRFDLQPWAFAKIIETLGPFYRGQNGNGALNFNHQYFEGLWYVNLAGELYQNPRYPEQDLHNPQEIPLSQFLIHTTFFTQDPTLNPTQTGFKFMANATNTGNYLSNGDRVWAQFDSVIGSDATENNQAVPQNLVRMPEDKPALSYVHQLPDVSGLDQISDPMHPLWWILIVLAGLITLGGVWFVVWHQRHHKLKIKKP